MDCDEKLTIAIVIFCATIFIAFIAAMMWLSGLPDNYPPEYIKYYDYPYGPNQSLVSLPVAICYPWYDLNAYRESLNDRYNWFPGNNGTYCLKRYH